MLRKLPEKLPTMPPGTVAEPARADSYMAPKNPSSVPPSPPPAVPRPPALPEMNQQSELRPKAPLGGTMVGSISALDMEAMTATPPPAARPPAPAPAPPTAARPPAPAPAPAPPTAAQAPAAARAPRAPYAGTQVPGIHMPLPPAGTQIPGVHTPIPQRGTEIPGVHTPMPQSVQERAAPPAPKRTTDPKAIPQGGTVVPTQDELAKMGWKGTSASTGDALSEAVVASKPTAPTKVPKNIGQYEIIRELGRGGMGVVYLARDSRLGRRVAVKLLQTEHPELTARFIVEAQATAQCNHENIVVIYEVGEHENAPFMVLEYLQGQTLTDLLEKSGAMQWSRVADIVVAVVRALVRAHSLGIVHRDLKPDNIFITETGQVKVLDFGIAKLLREEAQQIEPGHKGPMRNPQHTGMAGTLAYMSPEQWAGGKVDHRADIWAVGMILFEMLAGKHPLMHDLDNFQERVTNADIPMPSLLKTNPSVVKEFAEVVTRCLEKSPQARYPDAEELLKALEPFLPGRFKAWGNFDRGPYTGLRAFQEEDAACFFGRSAEVSAMVTRIFDLPMMAVVGPSGIGKSSFLRAGVVPALRSFGTNWRILVLRPGAQPLMALAAMLLSQLPDLLPEGQDQNQYAVNLGIRLKLEPGYLGQVLRQANESTGDRYLLFVDQFEELYTLCDNVEQRLAFTQCLTGAADDQAAPVRLVISVRSDFLGRLGENAHFMSEMSKGLFFLGPPGQDGLREALVQPAEMVGYRFETPEMVEEMMEHLQATPGALPLLQFTASQLWEKRDAGKKLLTKQSYIALGGISGALATHADQTVRKQSPEAQALCRSVFLQLVTPERTRAVREVDELYEIVGNPEALRPVLNELVQSRLLVLNTGGGGGGATVEIVHESLIEAWLMLRRWLEESHEDSMFLEQLRAAARQWSGKKKDSGLLWTGEMAEELFRFRRRFKGELSETVRSFADAVQTHLARRARLKRVFAFAGVGFLLVLLAAAGVALVVISRAQKQAVENEKVARVAQTQAQERLEAVQEKERARRAEEARRQAAEVEVAKANTTIDETKEQLAERNKELEGALGAAEKQKRVAQDAQVEAERAAKAAREAEERAKFLLKREQERADRLTKQLGSPVVETLK